ncbi:MAG: QueT transporter family protein [Clostridia bacterium]|nr:QueT transporter family protein [Clostridia bacterium]
MKNSVRFITRSALIAALYLVLSVAFQAISFGPVQLRVSEALVLLPVIMPEAIPGLAIGCFLTNFFFSPFGVYDIVLGTAATLIGAVLTYCLKKRIVLAAIPPIILNALLVPVVFALENPDIYLISAGEILLSQIISVGIIGIPVTLLLKNAFVKARIITPVKSKYDSQEYVRNPEDDEY